jgi:hypothetical protein
MIGAQIASAAVTTLRAFAWIKPWMVVGALTAVAAAGATGVYYVGEAQHRRDRADIVRWEARALPAANDASTLQRSLRAAMPVTETSRLRSRLQVDLDAIAGEPLPDIVKPAAAAYADAIRKTEASLDAIGTAGFEAVQTRANAAFGAAAAAVQTLVCRARLPACSGL